MSARQPWAVENLSVGLRMAGPDDVVRLEHFLAAMDREGLYQRHFAHGEAPNRALLARLACLDGIDRVAVLALRRDGEVLGHAEFVASGGRAEYALMVLPAMRSLGLGRGLLAALQDIATAAGQREMHGLIQAGNTAALRLALKQGFRAVPAIDRTTVIVSRGL